MKFVHRKRRWMSVFEVQCIVGGDRFCIVVPNDCSVGDVLKKVSEQSGVKAVSLWHSGIPLNLEHLFADYFEPDAIYHVRVGGNYPDGSLLNCCETKLKAIGVAPEAPQLLMEVSELKWSMDEFLKKADGLAPTLVLIKMKNGTVCGGVAGVPWPRKSYYKADPAKGSFIFSLGAAPARFDLVNPEEALYCCHNYFGFGYDANDLFVWDDGDGCGSCADFQHGRSAYTGPRGQGQLVGATDGYNEPYERWEPWRL
jgi:hypothetical protein